MFGYVDVPLLENVFTMSLSLVITQGKFEFILYNIILKFSTYLRSLKEL